MRVGVIIPTTERPATILRLTPLAVAPRSVLRTQDDYRPLPPSSRYNAFVQPGGPLAGQIELGPGQFELRLGAVVETGRSWELPVALAHWLHAGGHDLDAQAAGLVVWATGALDNDLRVLPQNYHLETKLDRSRDMLSGWLDRGIPIIALIPEGVALPRELQNHLFSVHIVSNLTEAIEIIGKALAPGEEQATGPIVGNDGPALRARVWFAAGAVLLLAALFWVAVRSFLANESPSPVARLASKDASAEIAATMVPQEAEEVAGDSPPAPNAEGDATLLEAEEADPRALPTDDFGPEALPLLIFAHAPENSTCRSVLFGPDVPERTERQAAAEGYGNVVSNNLCSIGFELPVEASVPVEITFPDPISAQILPSDRRRRITLQPGESHMFRLRADLPAAIDVEFTVVVSGAAAAHLRLFLERAR